MNATAQKLSFSINPEKIKKVVNLSVPFAGTDEPGLKELFKDVLIEIPEGQETKTAYLSVSNSKDIFQIGFPLEQPVNLDEPLLIRVEAGKLKGIVNNFNETIKVEYTENYIKFKSKKSSIKIHNTPADMLKDQLEIIKMNKDSDKIATINANTFFEVINHVSPIPLTEQKKGKPMELIFTKDKIRSSAIQDQGHYAAASEIDYPCNVSEELNINIPSQVVPKIVQILKALKEKPVEIYINKEKTKLQIKTKLLNYTFFLSGENLPDVHSLIENLLSQDLKKSIVNKEQLSSAVELIKFVNGDSSRVEATTEGNKMILKSSNEEEVIKEIDASSPEKTNMIASSTIILKCLKIYSNSFQNENNLEILFNEGKKFYLLKHPEKEYPSIIFAGME